MTRLMTISALMTSIHQGWFSCSGTGLLHLDAVGQALGVLRRDPDDAGTELAAEARAQLLRRPVGAHAHVLARCDLARGGIVVGELDLRRRTLELELRDPLHRGAAEERAVADELEPGAGRLAGRRLRVGPGPGELVAGRQLGLLRRRGSGPGLDGDAEAL